MIEEAYVSFETAKLLKEKGFEEDCSSSYSLDGEFLFGYTKQEGFPLKAPTQQMAMRWLREIYNIHIELSPYKGGYDWAIYNKDIKKVAEECGFNDSYEEACEWAIRYYLENLI